MENQVNKIGMKPAIAAVTSTVGALYALCAAGIAIAPELSIKLINNVFHGIDLTSIMKSSFSFSGFLLGLLEVLLWSALFTVLFVAVYNKSASYFGNGGNNNV